MHQSAGLLIVYFPRSNLFAGLTATSTSISFTIMRRTFEHGAKARPSLSGGPHAPVNMADSMENTGSWTVSGSKEAMEVPKNFKDL